MYKIDNQVKTYHNLQPRRKQQNHSSVKNTQQTNTYPLPDQANINHSTLNYYFQANRSYGAPVQQSQVFYPQGNVGHYYDQYNAINHQQYRGYGQLQLISHPHGRNSSNSLQVNNSKYSNYSN